MKKVLFLVLMNVVFMSLNAQDSLTKFSNKSITTALGIGFVEAIQSGAGFYYEIGYQQSYWKNKLRFNPYILNGEYTSLGITDVPYVFFRNTVVGLKVGVDLLKYKAFSIATQVGYGFNYTRGLEGTGGDFFSATKNNDSDFFSKIHHTLTLGAGLRINPKNHRLAYEFHIVNFGIENDDFITAQFRLGIDVKL